ncbi:SDR family oxidoreductase [Synechococcus sp. CS-1325]|uniref:SDR family oxidoreductase n=1 Tax=unclassified Synechococcus TaxID=2626047 RepID=UPI000DB84F9F|nr:MULTISPECIES: SDR family oxidoreductase [unclassified Synechococcus]PZV02507.1 MAG: short-chain dehydrogenase [Cyanobium sp.]MCT0200454.1 SDR family oxidoreductase [Synechococcus sp. CS-1325]MCT0213043.1 SDR family oxidoreductase [Synechococcus sp. CS-1326]MCT0229799.1 SDR family oxidoreductase [Synechococcus sp. CS-1324]MCT0232288.1 SDR family oxidoreductase [Synechococcus sp. CS-1327]
MAAVLITGASRGIGAATARRFASAGWDLLLLARPSAELDLLADSLRSSDCQVGVVTADLNDADSITGAIHQLLSLGITPAVVINNAGAAYTGSLAEMTLSHWQWLLQLNVTSVFQVCQAVLPTLRATGSGLIINVSSHAARRAFPNWGAYCTSKAALEAFSRCLAEEERSHGVRVCTLTLGSVNTPLWVSDTVNGSFDTRAMLSADQAAEALLFLAQQPSTQVVEDLTLMPATGAF